MCGDTRDDASACRRFATKSRFASVFLGLKSQAVSCRSFAAKKMWVRTRTIVPSEIRIADIRSSLSLGTMVPSYVCIAKHRQ